MLSLIETCPCSYPVNSSVITLAIFFVPFPHTLHAPPQCLGQVKNTHTNARTHAHRGCFKKYITFIKIYLKLLPTYITMANSKIEKVYIEIKNKLLTKHLTKSKCYNELGNSNNNNTYLTIGTKFDESSI